MWLGLVVGIAWGADTRVTLTGGLGGAVAPPSLGAYGDGRLAIHAQARPWSLLLGAKEGWMSDDSRTLGVVLVQAVRTTDRGAYVRGGFVHHHETAWALATAHPIAAGLGSLAGITHRSGLEVGAGWDVAISERMLGDRLGVCADVGVSAFPDAGGPPVYVVGTVGVTLDVGAVR